MKKIENPIVLLNGISRSGKAVTWYIVGNVKGIDTPQNNPFSDWILDAYKAEQIKSEGLTTLLYEFFRLNSWFSFIGRNLNLKDIDQSAFLKFSTDKDLKERNSLPDNNDSWLKFSKKWRNSEFIPCFTSGLDNDTQRLLKNHDINFVNINTIRSPKRVFLEWCQTKRCSRYDDLDKMGVFYFQYKGFNIPGFAYDYKDNWIESSDEERCFLVIENYYKSFFNEDQTQKINIIFEDMVQDPFQSIQKISEFFGLPIKKDYLERLNLMNVPRVINDENYLKDDEGYFKKIKSSSLKSLNMLEEKFQNFRSEISS